MRIPLLGLTKLGVRIMMKAIGRIAFLTIFSGLLAGCAAVAIQGATRATDQASIALNEDEAADGDMEAQLEMADSHCCTIAGSAGVLNNQKATHWYCKAAKQGATRAKFELGRIYSGDLVRGMNGPATIGSFLTTQREHKSLALMWFELAAEAGHEDAAEEVTYLKEDMSLADVERANRMKATWLSQPCEWNDVYADNQL